MATAAICAVALVSCPASGQTAGVTASQSGEAQEDGTIVVTASRTASNGLDAPTPTQMIGAETIDRRGSETIMEVLNQNPAFKATRSPNANATNLSSPGQATADLRGLGGQRTLVLVNGSRIVPFAPAANQSVPTTTDLNLMPTIMIDRVDVVTGGASALYGSDAVSGVVNLIMKTRYEGIDVRAQTGISEQGDDQRFRAGFLAGSGFAGGRGHIVVSADYSDSKGVGSFYSRDWGRKGQLTVTDRTGPTDLLLANNVVNSLGAGGVIVTGPAALVGMAFNPDGSLRRFNYGSPIDGRVMVGGEGVSVNAQTTTVPAVERLTTYGSIYYDFSNSLTGYVEGGWSKAVGNMQSAVLRLDRQAIRGDNPFLPAAVQALVAPAATINISRIGFDIGNNEFRVTNETPHGTVGLKGKLGDTWSWDAHSSYGINYYKQRATQVLITRNLNFAIDAVDMGRFLTGVPDGNIVCRAVAQNNPAAAGCVPLNLIGEGNTSQGARDYIWGEPAADVKYTQFTIAANLVGSLFDLPGGPLKVAVGGEYRKETEKLTSDPTATVNGYLGAGNAVPYSGHFSVKEAYVEATAPIFTGFSVNGAARYADYSTAGGQTAWKAGAVYEAVAGLIFRVSRSRDIRAPAINELYSPGSVLTNPITLVVDGVSKTNNIPQNATAGNRSVQPELADTWTAGLAYQGRGGLRGVGLSIDYYKIDIGNAISNPTSAQVAALCSAGDPAFCSAFTYGPDPANPGQRIHTSFLAGTLNLGSFKQEGIDMTARYSSRAAFLGSGGKYSASASGTYVLHSIVDPGTVGSTPLDQVGAMNPYSLGAIPTFRGNLSQTLSNDQWEVSLETLYISSGIQDTTYNTPGGQTINDNHVPATWYFNLSGKFFAGAEKRYEFFWAVNNLLDQDPRATPYFVLNAPVNGQYYDKIGRRYTAGVRLRF
jgi:outer membrane receptor protein involved in Fe transport